MGKLSTCQPKISISVNKSSVEAQYSHLSVHQSMGLALQQVHMGSVSDIVELYHVRYANKLSGMMGFVVDIVDSFVSGIVKKNHILTLFCTYKYTSTILKCPKIRILLPNLN